VRRWLARGALLVSLAVLPQVAVPSGIDLASAAVPAGKHKPFPARPKPKINKVGSFTTKSSKAPKDKAAPAARKTRQRVKAAHWPAPGMATLDVPTTGAKKATAGALPVALAQLPAKKNKHTTHRHSSRSFTARLHSQRAATKAGVKGVLLTLDAKHAQSRDQKLRVTLDYKSFANAYGGSYGSRLQLVQLPACALTTPAKAKCRTQTPLTTSRNNERQQTLSADLSSSAKGLATGTPMVLAATAGASSSAGDFGATALGPSATWEAGGSTGDFTWNYPLRVPPATAGPSPNLAISYDSAGVDGRTAGENNQTSVVGEGFSMTESYIERKYGSCKDDGQSGKGDLCWKYTNATLVLNGKAAELVNACDTTSACSDAAKSQAAGGTWKLKNDDATKVEHLTGNTSNGDDNGEYWKITTTDGTQYYFGKHRLPGWSDHGTDADDPVTDSTWTVPVFGDDSGEPCNDTAGFASSSCNQAWKWNLDYVVDTHGNASTYWYSKETNNYAKNADTTATGTRYVRGGYLKRIDYGQRSDLLYTKPAAQKVTFIYAQRCVVTDGCASLTADTKANWPDVPYDMICADGKTCPTQIGPSFFTRYRLTDINTYVWTGTGTTNQAVDTWHLDQNFPDTGDSSSPSLWLRSIQATGKAGSTAVTTPTVTFGGIQMSNHVEDGSGTLRYIKWRVRTITSETGSTTTVNYSDPECINGTKMPSAEDKNTLRCFPVYWSQSGATPQLDWFHKYVVTSVFQDDPTGAGDTQETYYDYNGGAGWAYADDEGLTKEKYRTWSQWRGYAKVTVTDGDDTGTRGKKTTLYMRGLNGEREKDGTARVEKVTDSTGKAIDDSRQYAGFIRETINYNGADETSGTINDPWSYRTGKHVYDWGTTESWFVQPGATTTRTTTSSGTRTVKTTTSYDTTYGMPDKVDETGDTAKTGDESCTNTTYARNTKDWLVSFASRIETYSVGCTATPKLPDDTISDLTTGYDEQPVGTAPTKGDITSSYRLSGYTDSKADYQRVSTSAYDALGRPEDVTDALGHTTHTAYSPSDTGYGPLTSKTDTDPKGYTATTTIDPAWGSATKIVDANSKTTEWQFDALGRLVSVWKPDRVRLLGDAASIVYGYSITKDKASWVRTDTLKSDGTSYNSSYEIYDSLMRLRQKQTPSPAGGRLIAETLYDDRGFGSTTNDQVYDNNSPTGALANTIPGSVPASTETIYDGAGRATTSIFRVYDQEKWRTKNTYEGDRTSVTAAAGGSGTMTITDADGKTTERREYSGPNPTGTDYTRTKYTYTPGGQIETMTGPDDAVWRYTYDLRGRQKTAVDPDKGTVTSTYNDADQVTSTSTTTDGKTQTLITDYDELGRKKGTWDGTQDDAHQLTKFTYDTIAKGRPTASIRYVGGTTGKIYASSVAGYDAMYRPTGVKTVLAASDPLVAAGAPQTFTTSTAYNLDGTVQNTILPAAGGLPVETVAYSYNGLGLVTGVNGTTDYIRSVGYSPYGEPEQTTLGTSSTAKQLQVSNRYEDGTRRLANSHTLDQTNTGNTSDVDYAYDATGNVTSVVNKAANRDTQCFAYDGHRRLTEAWTPSSNDCATTRSATALGGPAPYWNSWTYKVGGLRDTQTAHTATGDTKTAYAYPPVDANGTGQPHTLSSTTTGSKTSAYDYDGQGNTTARPGPTGTTQSLGWDTEGELTSLTEGTKTTSYLYDAAGELLIRRGPSETVLYLPGQELHYDTATQKFTAQRYYAAGDGTALRTNTGLSWIVDDQHSTASMVVDATTQAITRRYEKPFGEPRGSTPTVWPDDKGFLGKPADETTGLTHIGAREYDPGIGRFLSADPVLAPDDHESLNGYAYANNTPVTLSDPTGLVPGPLYGNAGCGKGCTVKESFSKDGDKWVYHSTLTYVTPVRFKSGNVGALISVVQSDGGTTRTAQVLLKGPKPLPQKKGDGECNACWAMGTNPHYDANAHDIPKATLATWQKVVLGVVGVLAAAVAVAPVAAVAAPACLAAAPVCIAEAAELATGGASGGSAVVGAGVAGSAEGGDGLYRQLANKGSYKGLLVPMKKRSVREAANLGGIGMDGVRVKILRQDDLIGSGFYGHTSKKGWITLYPDAFTDMDTLVRTIGHERTHVMQFDVHGPVRDAADGIVRENAGFGVEESFSNYYKNGGKPY
jgi:RHS repeat-associated protein